MAPQLHIDLKVLSLLPATMEAEKAQMSNDLDASDLSLKDAEERLKLGARHTHWTFVRVHCDLASACEFMFVLLDACV